MAKKFDELDVVALTDPIHDHGLWDGDEGTVVHVHRGGSYSVEFVRGGDTIGVVEVPASKLRLVWRYSPQAARAG